MSQDTSTLPTSETDTPVFASKAERKQRVNDNKLSKRIMREVGRAIGDFNMIEEGDRQVRCWLYDDALKMTRPQPQQEVVA